MIAIAKESAAGLLRARRNVQFDVVVKKVLIQIVASRIFVED